MKKMAFGIVLILASLGLMTSPVMADPSQGVRTLSAADQAFLATLALPGTPAPTPAARRPGLLEKDSCSATVDCGNGTSVTCNGTTASGCTGAPRNCGLSEHGHVTCIGEGTKDCIDCPCEISEQVCESTCNGCYRSFTCSPYSCVCGPPCA